MLKKNAANIITCTRIIGTAVMIFMPTLSLGFYIAYAYAGITDVVDGYVARKTGTASDFGAKLDSISDLFFYISMLLKILPVLIQELPNFVMNSIYFIFAFRICLYVFEGIHRHKFVSNHTVFNKATGFMLYFVPFLLKMPISTVFASVYASAICILGIIAAIYEIVILRKNTKN